jgi:hypothetical protein
MAIAEKENQAAGQKISRLAPWLAFLIGGLAGFWVLGGDVVNVKNTGWLKSDLAQVYLGWAFFRLDPHWHFPLAYTDCLSYPLGCAISNNNAAPLVAVLFKPFAAWLPTPFQYVGLLGLLNSALQSFFGYKLCRRFTENALLALLGGLFFVFLPAFAFHFATDMVLTGQWLILAALWIYFRGPAAAAAGAVRGHAAVLFVAGGLNPYLAAMCALILFADMIRSVPGKKLRQLWVWLLPLAALLVSWLVFGFVQFGAGAPKSALGGYGDASLNLLAPINPDMHMDFFRSRSLLFPGQAALPVQTGCYEYLGAGIIFMFVGVLAANWRSGRRLALPVFRPLWLLALLSFIFAVSNKVTFGKFTLLEVPLPYHPFGALFSIFRASERFFWPTTYILLIFSLQYVFRQCAPRRAFLLLAALLGLQIADTQPLRDSIQGALHTSRERLATARHDAARLADPFWNTIGGRFQKLVVLPAWQARPNDTALPGGPDNWQDFGFIASDQKMALNLNYMARPVPRDDEMQITILPAQVRAGRLDADTLYVLDPSYLLEFIDQRAADIAGRRVDDLLVFWHTEAAPENPLRLQALLDQTLAQGVDLKQLAAGFVLPPATPVPYVPAQGFALPADVPFYSQGATSEIPVFIPPNQRLKKIILVVAPLAGGPVPEQKFSVTLAGQALGDYALKEPGPLVLEIPAGLVKKSGTTTAVRLRFAWKTPVSPESVKNLPAGGPVRFYRRLLALAHIQTAPDPRLNALNFRSMQLEFGQD